MSLVSNVQSRFSTTFLAQITNPQNPASTSLDSTRLSLAATDTEADFRIYCGVTYDDTDARHVNVGVEGVIIKLMMRTGQWANREIEERWHEKLKALAMVTGRDRISPLTTGSVAASSEQANQPALFDEGAWRAVAPHGPGPAPTDDILRPGN
jgi:hypothetical protein